MLQKAAVANFCQRWLSKNLLFETQRVVDWIDFVHFQLLSAKYPLEYLDTTDIVSEKVLRFFSVPPEK
jgi:hypothetical protein